MDLFFTLGIETGCMSSCSGQDGTEEKRPLFPGPPTSRQKAAQATCCRLRLTAGPALLSWVARGQGPVTGQHLSRHIREVSQGWLQLPTHRSAGSTNGGCPKLPCFRATPYATSTDKNPAFHVTESEREGRPLHSQRDLGSSTNTNKQTGAPPSSTGIATS